MTPIKFYIGLGVAIIISVGAALFGQHYASLKQAAAQNQIGQQKIGSTSAQIKTGQTNAQDRATVQKGVEQGKAAYTTIKQEAKKNEQTVADRADRAVPVSVRDAYRARRLSRERSGCVRSERQSGCDPDTATER